MSDTIIVTDADRQAACHYLRYPTPASILSGDMDNVELVQLFAKHRVMERQRIIEVAKHLSIQMARDSQTYEYGSSDNQAYLWRAEGLDLLIDSEGQ